ncbi:MAG: MltA domain-containing protein [Lautropia sp.]
MIRLPSGRSTRCAGHAVFAAAAAWAAGSIVLAAVALPAAAAAPAPFSTTLGTFTPQPWSALSGWADEAHAEALAVFRQTCRTLQRRDTWRPICREAQTVAGDAGSARAFFEQAFVPYRVAASDRGKEGLMTGYFEPVLNGSPVRRPPFVVPVHAAPGDLLLLDARDWPRLPTDGSGRAAINGNRVVPAGDDGVPIDAAVFDSEPLDRRFRVRHDGDRIVPYWTRQQIDAGARVDARVLAWVDDPQALYLMQVQGSGQVRMADGKLIRLSYAEQNGHPFRPRGTAPTASRTRGIVFDNSAGSNAGSNAGRGTDSNAGRDAGSRRAGTGGIAARKAAPGAPGSADGIDRPGAAVEQASAAATVLVTPVPDPPVESRALDPKVNRIVDALLAMPPQPAQSPPARTAGTRTRNPLDAGGSGAALRVADARAAMNLDHLVAARANDPSYVFFQPAAATGSGPLGALGVPLTPTRSLAIDPRSTPLGAPVFIEAERADTGAPIRRLMFAQDTGGAIRGAVRADFYWGTGPRAGAQAIRTRDDLAMWVLLPADYVPPRGAGTRTRSIGAAPDCVMPDSDYC